MYPTTVSCNWEGKDKITERIKLGLGAEEQGTVPRSTAHLFIARDLEQAL